MAAFRILVSAGYRGGAMLILCAFLLIHVRVHEAAAFHHHASSSRYSHPSLPATALQYRPFGTRDADDTATSLTAMSATKSKSLPVLSDYQIDSNDRVVGVCTGHPDIGDGEVVTTSPLRSHGGSSSVRRLREGAVVTTQSGSRYRLGACGSDGASGSISTRDNHDNNASKGNGNDDGSEATDANDTNEPPSPSSKRTMADLHVLEQLDLDRNFFGRSQSSTAEAKTSQSRNGKADPVGTSSAAANSDDSSTAADQQQQEEQEIPTLDEWRILSNDRVIGSVLNHTVFTNGDVVTTSAITHPEEAADGRIVTTYSGSKYRLGTRMGGWRALVGTIAGEDGGAGGGGGALHVPDLHLPDIHIKDIMHLPDMRLGDMLSHLPKTPSAPHVGIDTAAANADASGAAAAAAANGVKTERDSSTVSSSNESSKAQQKCKSKSKPKKTKQQTLRERKRAAKLEYDLTGQTAGPKGQYLISGKPFRTTSGKSHIYSAYESDADGLPTKDGDVLALKVSTNCAALTREASNYDRIVAGGYGRRFVTKHEFLNKWKGPSFSSTACALVLEAGKQDLKSVMAARGSQGLDGPAMRDAAYAAALCVQAMHSVGLVWTDLKPENFIVTTSSIGHGNDGLEGVKGIDLESAIPAGENPVDYSPEACPPEFAVEFHNGEALDHVLDYTYDIWSLGMLLYELSTGRSYFETETPDEITQILSNDFRADVRAVERNRLRNLIGKCLQRDPKKRPRIAEVLYHPYFLTTGMGWF